MAKYTAEQKRNAAAVLKSARRNGATAMERRAAMETILVESNARHLNLGEGDRDSVGAFQQRPSQGWGPAGESISKDADQFFAAARKLRGKYKQAGQLAQAVQRSAFPDRYHQRRGDAVALEQVAGGGSSLGQAREPRANVSAMADDGAVRRLQVVANRRARRGVSTSRIDAMVIVSQAAVAAAAGLGAAAPAGRSGASKPPPGKTKAGAIKELFYDPEGGWKHGASIGAIGGHGDHVHVAADTRRQKWLQKKAQSMGLAITSTTGGKHATGSYHYSDQAFDAAGTPEAMAAFTKEVRRKYGLR